MVRVTAMLIALVIASALGVVTSQHKSRQLVTLIEREQLHTRSLQDEWIRMDIEQQSVAALPTVERLARGALHMDAPDRASQITLDLSGQRAR